GRQVLIPQSELKNMKPRHRLSRHLLILWLFWVMSALCGSPICAQTLRPSPDDVHRFIGDWDQFDPGLLQWLSADDLLAAGAQVQPPSKDYVLKKVIHTVDSFPNVGDFNLIPVNLQGDHESLSSLQREERI